ncbi:MAG: FtsQ-type POTRA domain-containing protein [Gemmatimonadota bacterium]|nr:MAG: FtsQ-type POTRA domain-containing protein [Gemmatimonadota bacterium]
MRSTKKMYFNEIAVREPRHVLLALIKAFNRTTVVVTVLGFLALMGHHVYTWALQTPFFEIQEIRVRGHHIISEERALSLIGIEEDCNIFRCDVDAVERRVAQDPFVRKADVKRRLPSKLLLSIEERKPLAFLADMIGMVDDEGVLLPPIAPEQWSDLPLLTGIGVEKIRFGEPLQSEPVAWAVSFLKAAAALNSNGALEITEIDLSDMAHPLLYAGDRSVPVRIGVTGSLSQLTSLPVVLADLERKGIEAEYIDVRFSNQILVRPRRFTNMGLESKAVKG